MHKVVTQLLDNICACRDILGRADLKEITCKVHLFETVANEARRQINKVLSRDYHELDFASQDLAELSSEIKTVLNSFESEFDYDIIMQKISQYEVIDSSVITKEANRLADVMNLDKKLRECYKLLAYLAVALGILERSNRHE